LKVDTGSFLQSLSAFCGPYNIRLKAECIGLRLTSFFGFKLVRSFRWFGTSTISFVRACLCAQEQKEGHTVDPEVRQHIGALFMKFDEAFNNRDRVLRSRLKDG
jgi:hypothetical protein